MSEAVAHYGTSLPIVYAAFAEYVRMPVAAPLPPVPACDRSHTGFVGATGTAGLLAQVEGCTSAATIARLNG